MIPHKQLRGLLSRDSNPRQLGYSDLIFLSPLPQRRLGLVGAVAVTLGRSCPSLILENGPLITRDSEQNLSPWNR